MTRAAAIALCLIVAGLCACSGGGATPDAEKTRQSQTPEERVRSLLELEHWANYTVVFNSIDGDWQLRRTRSNQRVRWDEALFRDAPDLWGSSAIMGVNSCHWSLASSDVNVSMYCIAGGGTDWTSALDPLFAFAADPGSGIEARPSRTFAGVAAECFIWAFFDTEFCLSSTGILLFFNARHYSGARYAAEAILVNDEEPESTYEAPIADRSFGTMFPSRTFTLDDVRLPKLPRLEEELANRTIGVRNRR